VTERSRKRRPQHRGRGAPFIDSGGVCQARRLRAKRKVNVRERTALASPRSARPGTPGPGTESQSVQQPTQDPIRDQTMETYNENDE